MVYLLSRHRIDYCDVIRDRSDVGEGRGHEPPAFTIRFEFMLWAKTFQFVTASLKLCELLSLGEGFRHGLSAEPGQFRFVVQGLKMGGAACHAEVNDSFGFRREV